MVVTIKRENWKGKYRVVARDKGRIVTHAKFTVKQNTNFYKKVFKRNNTFVKSRTVTRERLTNVTEVVQTGNVSKPKSRYQYFVEARVGRKEKISARSKNHDKSFPLKNAKEEATESFWERVAQRFGGQYDAEEGQKFKARITNIKQGIVYYTA